VGVRHHDRILLVQGPLGPAVRPGRWLPRIDNAAWTAADPPTARRWRSWLRAGVQVRGRPEWLFFKMHTHGAPERQADALLGEPTRLFHEALRGLCGERQQVVLHYVTAREMFNIAAAAMDGRSGNPGQYRDYALAPPALALRRAQPAASRTRQRAATA
jgi:hypothetical protein